MSRHATLLNLWDFWGFNKPGAKLQQHHVLLLRSQVSAAPLDDEDCSIDDTIKILASWRHGRRSPLAPTEADGEPNYLYESSSFSAAIYDYDRFMVFCLATRSAPETLVVKYRIDWAHVFVGVPAPEAALGYKLECAQNEPRSEYVLTRGTNIIARSRRYTRPRTATLASVLRQVAWALPEHLHREDAWRESTEGQGMTWIPKGGGR